MACIQFDLSQKITLLILSLVASFTLIIASSCSDNHSPAQKAVQDKILLIGIGGEASTIDPTFSTSTQDERILSAIFECLVNLNSLTLAPEPACAQSWEISKDGLTYLFFLRTNATWSNGDSVTAHDFAFSFKRVLSPTLGAPYANLLHSVRNARAYNEGNITDFNDVGIKVVDTYTLQITLERPTPYFISVLGHFTFYPLHRPTLDKFGAIDKMDATWTRPENIVTNGPFTLKSWTTNDFVEVIKNPNFWNSTSVKLNGIRFFPTSDLNAEERAFRAGQLHITQEIPPILIRKYIAEKSPLLHIYPIFATYFFSLNTTQAPLNDARVRQALSLAINRKEITNKIFQNGSNPAYSLIPKGISGYTGIKDIEENIPKARALLAQAGYANGQNFPIIDISYNAETLGKTLTEVIQSMWKKNLNINCTLTNKELKMHLTDLTNGNFMVARSKWIGDIVDPYSFLSLFIKDATQFKTHWSNDRYDQLIAQADNSSTTQERFDLYRQAENLLLEESPIIPFTYASSAHLISPHVKGIQENLIDRFNYIEIELVE